MKISTIAASVFLLVTGAPAFAQSVPADVRCLVISNVFAQRATTAVSRESAAKSMLFYLGRLDGRADSASIITAMRALGGKIDHTTAPAEMSACAARVAQAQQTIQAASRAAAPPK